jgi:hypothetical protein
VGIHDDPFGGWVEWDGEEDLVGDTLVNQDGKTWMFDERIYLRNKCVWLEGVVSESEAEIMKKGKQINDLSGICKGRKAEIARLREENEELTRKGKGGDRG